MAKLVYTAPSGQRSELELGPGQPVAIVGRLNECQIRTADTSVSRRHSQFTWRRAGAQEVVDVQDLGSSNGTFVNDQPISATVTLQSSDRVRCGNFQVEVILAPAQPAGYGGPPGIAGPPGADAPTRMGPSAGGFSGGPSGLSSSPPPPKSSGPYLEDPSMAVDPGPSVGGYGNPHVETVDYQRSGPSAMGGGSPMVPSGLSADQLRAELERALRRADALAGDVERLQYENQRLVQRGGGYTDPKTEAELRRARGDLDAARDESEELRKEESRLKAQIDALSDRNSELKDQFSALQDQQGELRDKLREAREDLDNALFKRDELSADVERLEKDKVELFDQLTKLKVEYNHLERAHEQTQKDYGLLEFEYKRLDENNQELERELRATLEGESEQTDSLNRLQEIVDEKEEAIRELRDRIDELKADLSDQSQDNTWMVEVERLKRENDELDAENEELQSRIEELQEIMSAQKASAAGSNEEQASELASLREEVERLRRRLKDRVAPDTYNAVQSENEELRLENRRLKEQVASAQDGTGAGTEELNSQIRQLTEEKLKLES
ncbi:MAG: FHA domain-containing protein, partial [Myxococcales bacterium]|nr:FHA domain-containing protein [Myxococcales bacterium]